MRRFGAWRSAAARRISILAIAAGGLAALVAGCSDVGTAPENYGIHGQVLLPNGTPAANAMLQLMTVAPPTGGGIDAVVLDYSEADGRFHLEVPGPGRYHLLALGFDLAVADTVLVPARLQVAAPEIPIWLRLQPSATVRGRATLEGASNHGGSFVGARGLWMGIDGFHTSADGEYAMSHVPVGRWTVEIYRSGFRPARLTAVVTTPGQEVRLPDVVLEALDPAPESLAPR